MEKEKYFTVFKNYKKRASNLIADISTYDSWTDSFCREEIKDLYSELIKYFKGVDFTQFTINELKKLDFGMWDDNIILMPSWAIDCITEGQLLTSIDGEDIIYNSDRKLGKDTRFGLTAFGFKKSQLRESRLSEILEGNKKTRVISAFPGCGKSHYFRENKDLIVLDSDSSTFDKSDFPRNYIEHIKSNIGKADIIMVSSHKEVREALVDNDIKFELVYPDLSIKEEFIQRYKDRGSPEKFIGLLESNWQNWIGELESQTGCEKKVLGKGKYLSDVI